MNRTLKRVMWPAGSLVGIRPLFDDKGQLIGITSAGRIFRGGGGECMSLTAETAKKVLYKPMVPIGLAPAQYDPAMLRR